MNAFLSALMVAGIILLVNLILTSLFKRPAHWIKATFFAAGFGLAIFINEHFEISGISKYVVVAIAAIIFYYIGQAIQKYPRPSA